MGFERKNRKVSQLVSPLRFLITESFKLTGYSFPGLKGTQDFSMMKIGLSHNGSLEKRIFPPDIPPRRITQDMSYMRPVIGSTYTASLSERPSIVRLTSSLSSWSVGIWSLNQSMAPIVLPFLSARPTNEISRSE